MTWLEEQYDTEYQAGREAFLKGLSEEDNPHSLSGHERDTTFEDELHFHWWRGFTHASDV